jgi:hypothetical protein
MIGGTRRQGVMVVINLTAPIATADGVERGSRQRWDTGSRVHETRPVGRRSRHREERKNKGVCKNSTRESKTEYMKRVVRHIPLPSVVGRDLNWHLGCNMRVVGDSRLHKFNRTLLHFMDVVRRSRAYAFRKSLACRELSASAIACLPDRAIVALIPAEPN